jgi:hypothetical protein
MPSRTDMAFEGDTSCESMLDRAPRVAADGSTSGSVQETSPDVVVHGEPSNIEHVAEPDGVVG